jgi:hypothetical protein
MGSGTPIRAARAPRAGLQFLWVARQPWGRGDAYAHTKAALVGEVVARVENETPADAERAVAVWTAPESRAARAAKTPCPRRD